MNMNKGPLAELITRNCKQYRDHLAKGGEPIKLILELHPCEDEAMKWEIKGKVPEGTKGLVALIQFTHLIREQITRAIQPDKVLMKITAPFTEEQVKHLNAHQKKGEATFTCGNVLCYEVIEGLTGRPSPKLIATTKGWVCPKCDYTQDWAWDFMARPIPTQA